VQQVFLVFVSSHKVFFNQVLDSLFYLRGLRLKHVQSCKNVAQQRAHVDALSCLHNSHDTCVDCKVTVLCHLFLLKNLLKYRDR